MGCDIHLAAEVRQDGVWTPAQEFENEEGCIRVKGKGFYGGRNYRLFSILADVRNGYGFAGVRTGEGFCPISPPRGIPEDCHPATRLYLESYDPGHSHSYHTMAQLLEFDWTQVSRLQGVLSAKEFWDWDRYSRGQGEGPESWCGGVGGIGVRVLEEEEMRPIINAKLAGIQNHAEKLKVLETELPGLYVRCAWDLPYYKCADEFMSCTMPRLWKLGRPEDVRILFFFDN